MICPPESDQDNESRTDISSAVLENYLAVIAEIAWCLGITCPDVALPHQQRLLRMRSRLAFAADEQALAETRGAIENELRTFAERARELLERRADDLRRILKAFAQVTEVLADRNEAGARQFVELSERVGEIAGVAPWLNVRDALREIVSDAGAQVDVLRLESQLAQAHAEEQMRVFRSCLEARNPQNLDLLTGLGNRQAVEEQIARRVESGKPFTLLLFETGDLGAIAASAGAAAADQLLVQAASRLAGQVRAHDYVGRWDSNEFAIVMECPVEAAAARSQQIARWVSGAYVLRSGATETPVEATFTVRVADASRAIGASAPSADGEPAASPCPT